MKKLNFENIDPFVRYAQFLKITSNRQYVNTAAYDYRLFFCSGGSGKIIVDGISYEMKIGSLVMWPPGFRYSLLPGKGYSSLELIGISFDYTGENRHKERPIPPDKWRNFDPTRIVELIHFEDLAELNYPLYIADVQFLCSSIYNLATEYVAKKDFFIPRTSGLLKSNLAIIGRFAADSSTASKSQLRIDQLIQYLHSHYNEKINNEILGEYFGYHPNHLNRLLVKHTGMSIHQYLIDYRVRTAVELLQASDMRTSEIAEAVGFKDTTHFLKYFKKVTGKNTKDFRR